MKFTISYKFKQKMAQNLSGWSRPVGAGAASASSAGADRCRPVPAPLTDRKKRCILEKKFEILRPTRFLTWQNFTTNTFIFVIISFAKLNKIFIIKDL